MLVDFLAASLLAITGWLGLSALTTDTLALNREAIEYTMAHNALYDLVARWRLEGDLLPGAAVGDLCAGSGGWVTVWCDTEGRKLNTTLGDWQVCGDTTASGWQWRLSWRDGVCVPGDQPVARVNAS